MTNLKPRSGRAPEVIVVGLGAHGAATLYQLARAGVNALGIDRWYPPHAFGSSHGETRITRLGVGEGEVYTPIAMRSHAIWRELEAATGTDLLLTCGILIMAVDDDRAQVHGKSDFLGAGAAAARRYGVPHERLTSAEVRYRFPQFAPPDDHRAYHEPSGGLVYAERCIAAQLSEAERLGATILRNTVVRRIDSDSHEARVVTDGGVHVAGRVIVAAGAWTAGLIGEPLRAMRLQPQILHWFPPDDPATFAADRCPVFMWMHGPRPEDTLYGLPLAPGATPAVKVATETIATIAGPDALHREPDPGAAARFFADHLKGRVLGLGPTAVKSQVCVYTTAPDGDFVVGWHGGHERVLVASACSGHGFKHSAALGELLARAAVAGALNDIPSAFDMNRLS